MLYSYVQFVLMEVILEDHFKVSVPNVFIYLNFSYQTRAKNNISIVHVHGSNECYRAGHSCSKAD